MWAAELKRRSSADGAFRFSQVVQFAAKHDAAWRSLFPTDPRFAAPGIGHAECVYFCIENDDTLIDGKRRDLEFWAAKTLRIESSLYMLILDDGAVHVHTAWHAIEKL